VTVTPPYEEVSYSELVAALASSPLVAADTVVVLEYPCEMGTLPQVRASVKRSPSQSLVPT
jgi:23S rRNA A2030 N6-methylase RlmJ